MKAQAFLLLLALAGTAYADAPAATTRPERETISSAVGDAVQTITASGEEVAGKQDGTSAVQWIAAITVLSLVPALAVLVTSFTRIIVVLGLLRQALGTSQLPPNTILFGLALLMTVVVMTPVFESVRTEAFEPYSRGAISQDAAIGIGETHVRTFMIRQFEAAGDAREVTVFLPESADGSNLQWSDVPTTSLVPAFVLRELKVAFLIGLRIFLPFVIIDMLVGAILVSMGMFMLPPTLVSLPLKLLLFVLADGWTLVAGTLMAGFAQ